MRTLRPVLAVVVMAAAVAFSLAGGAGSGSGATTYPCPPTSGRQFCITVTDTDGVSASVDGVVSYVLYTIAVGNVGGPTLTNGVVTTTLSDHVGTTTPSSSAQFIAGASSPGCAAVSGPANTVACNVGNLAGGQSLAPLQLVYRTSSTTGVELDRCERRRDVQGEGERQPETTTRTRTPARSSRRRRTSRVADCSQAWAPHDQPVTLATAPDGDTGDRSRSRTAAAASSTRLDESRPRPRPTICVSGKRVSVSSSTRRRTP